MHTSTIEEQIHRITRDMSAELSALGEELWRNPETGFQEHATMRLLLPALERLGLSVTTWPGTTGFMADIDTGRPGPCICIMAELDALICPDHPDCVPATGAVHACGHHVQMVAAIGAAKVLLSPEIREHLCGKVRIMGVPAEECLQIDWRLAQIKAGNLHYLSGKAELLYRGAFDDVDVAISVHASTNPNCAIGLMGTNNGFLAKYVTLRGRSAHAASPYDGINALYMANTAITALNGIRETFRDEDSVRIHPIITNAGAITNVIPDEANIECLCRGASMEAIVDAGEKFDRAMGAGAYAFGGKAEIRTQPGYLPNTVFLPLWSIADEVAQACTRERGIVEHGEHAHTTGSSDLGDVQSVLPAIQCYTGFAEGALHSAQWHIVSTEAYRLPTEFLALFALRLLENGGSRASAVKAAYKPMFSSAAEYCAFCNRFFSTRILP